MTRPEAHARADVALADTSVFIALEQDRSLSGAPPQHVAVSVITVAELRLRVLAASDGPTERGGWRRFPEPMRWNRCPSIAESLTLGRRFVSLFGTRPVLVGDRPPTDDVRALRA